jgi:transmembrane sensor
MNPPPDELDRIEQTAAEWLTACAEELSPVRARAFDRWRRADPRHTAAVARLEQACAFLEEMPLIRPALQPVVEFPAGTPTTLPSPAPPAHTAWLRLAAGIAAVLTLSTLGWWQWSRAHPATLRFATSAGGYERVVLDDGSVVELNASTELRVQLAPHARRVALVAGEAHFTVAHDKTRPFIVTAGHVAVRAVGTAFNVRRADSAVEVLVTEGRVAVAQASVRAPSLDHRSPLTDHPSPISDLPSPASASELGANERLLVPDLATPLASATQPGSAPPIIEKIPPELVRAALAWQERKLVFADTPLREVVAQFNRRNRLQLVLADATLAERPVGGTFAADNVEGFVRLFENGHAFQVERRSEFEIVLRAAR